MDVLHRALMLRVLGHLDGRRIVDIQRGGAFNVLSVALQCYDHWIFFYILEYPRYKAI